MLKFTLLRFSLADILINQCVVRRCVRAHAVSHRSTPSSSHDTFLSASLQVSACPTETLVTVIPMLHIASRRFYDAVVNYIVAASLQCPTHVLLEGVLPDEDSRVLQEQEYLQIQSSHQLRAFMHNHALGNTLYSEEVQQAMCDEMRLSWSRVKPLLGSSSEGDGSDLRLQDCYFKPMLAAATFPTAFTDSSPRGASEHHAKLSGGVTTPGDTFRVVLHNADVEERALLAAALESSTTLAGSAASIADLGKLPSVRRARERRCAAAAASLYAQADAEVCLRRAGGATTVQTCDLTPLQHIVIPWGYYHTDGIANELTTNGGFRLAAADNGAPLQRLSFGLTKEIISEISTS